MAKLKLNPLFEGMSGTIGDFVLKKGPNGQTIVSKKPDMTNVKASPAQLAQRQRFKLANQYASDAMADPDMRAFYEQRAAREGRSAYEAARSDYFVKKDLLSAK